MGLGTPFKYTATPVLFTMMSLAYVSVLPLAVSKSIAVTLPANVSLTSERLEPVAVEYA